MNKAQQFIPVEAIDSNLVFLKDGSLAAVLQTSAVNFGLLSEVEQVGIIDSFAGLLNSLSFAIQIVIRSERLDVSSYLTILDKAYKTQTNPLLARMTSHYRTFVESMIRENDVLDKKFYIAINVSPVEIGLTSKSHEDTIKKAVTVLTPRVDHLMRQLARIGLKATRLTTPELVKLLYEFYNTGGAAPIMANPTLNPPISIPRPPQTVMSQAERAAPPFYNSAAQPAGPRSGQPTPQFVVEELHDDYGP